MTMLCNLEPLLCVGASLNHNLNICHFNAQSIAPKSSSIKLLEIKKVFENSKYGIIGITETWLKSYITNTGVRIQLGLMEYQ